MFEELTGDFIFQAILTFIGIIFVIVIGVIILAIVKGISQRNKNNNSPKLYVMAKVVAKRTAIRGGGETRAYNDYFVTFEVEGGDRLELEVKDSDYGMLVEGDKGKLQFQGTRYLGFNRLVYKAEP